MTQEQLRKELEDCWAECSKEVFAQVNRGNWKESGLIAARDKWIATRLAALGDGDVKDGKWKLVGHSGQIADTGDYDGCYELTDGKISIFTKDDDEEGLQEIINVLNQYDRNFFMDDSQHWEIESLKLQLQELKEPKPLADGEGENDYVEGLKKLLRMADCPEILIENPYLLKGRKPTDADYAWAEGVIKRYEEHNKNIAELNVDWKTKYEKCINIIKRFDAGIIGMYDL